MPHVDARELAGGTVVVYLHPDASVREAVANSVERQGGLSVHGAASPDEVLSIVDSAGVDCLVTAADLPAMDAIAVHDLVRQEGITIPVVIHAANGTEALAAAALAADVSGYVPAPDGHESAVEELIEVIDDVVDGPETAAALERRWQTVESLHDVALEFETCASPAETYQFAVEAMARMLDVYACVIYINEDEVLVPKATVGDLPDGWQPYGVSEGVAGRTYQDGVSSRTDHIQSDDDAAPIEATLQSGISVPVGDVGVLQAVSTTPAAYDEHDQKLAELLAAHVSAAAARIESEAAVRTERDRFAHLFEHVPDAVAITRGETYRVVDVNPAFEETFGLERGDIVGEPIDDYVIPPDGESIRLAEHASTGETVADEVVRLADGESRTFLYKGFAIDGEDGVREYAIYTDITERKHRERELRRYKRLVEAVADPMYVLDADGRVEMTNRAMADVLGTSLESLQGAKPASFMPGADIDRASEAVEALALDPKTDWVTFEMTVEPYDGDPFVAETNASPLFDDGEFAGTVGVIRDISRRKEVERRIRDLHEGTRRLMAAEGTLEVAEVTTAVAAAALEFPINGVFLYDESADGLALVANTAEARETLGDAPTVRPGDGLMWEAYETGEPASYGDVRSESGVMNPDTVVRSEAYVPLGEFGVICLSSTVVDDFDEETLGLAQILGSNVEAALERAERESTLATRTAELERQNERLDQFAATVSHDLRNPLTLANGHLDAARETADATTDRHLDEVRWALDRMDDLIEDVLELARSGRQLVETTTVDLGAVAGNAHRAVDPDLDVSIEGSLGVVEGSPQRLASLFENCVRNAREHVGDDVAVTVRRTDHGFAIDDDGPGIPPDERDAVLETGYTTATTGTGFGLAIVTDVVDAHGWSLAIEDSPEGGARFHVRTHEATE